jgi:hypothetical protein
MAQHLKELGIYGGHKESGQGFHPGLIDPIDYKPKNTPQLTTRR